MVLIGLIIIAIVLVALRVPGVRYTVTCWRKIRISVSLARSERASKASQPNTEHHQVSESW
jgi:hypothetical protein